jgi:aspartyl-tRNA(Asn)/glutamyl-tRNA(Gln) amidotransferase subunit A
MGLYRDRIASRDAEVVARLRSAGAAILGTVNMHEAALGAHTDNVFYGRTHNPHRHDYTPGGSSGGSGAAVAAGLCDLALGTDTMGSVRIPAAYCGVYGLKPTNGAISEDGLAFLEPSLDCIGPLARDLDVLERAWNILAIDPGEARPFRHAWVLGRQSEVEVQPAVAAGFEAARRALPLACETLDLPERLTDVRMAGLIAAGHWLVDDLGPEYRANNPDLSDELKVILAITSLREACPEVLARTRVALREAIGTDTVLIMPTAPQVAFAHGTRAPSNQADFTCLANVAGLPALALPSGWSEDGLPVSVQLVGPPGSEPGLIALARQLDNQLQAYRRPPQSGI